MATYACSDLHGCLDVWQEIQKRLKKDDSIYVLGDCGDRGPQPWETIKAVLKEPRAIYLKGNHEDMLVKAMEDYLVYDEPQYESYSLLVSNVGEETFFGWMREEYKRDWKNLIKNLPLYKVYPNLQGQIIYLSHAGFTPKIGYAGFKFPSEQDLLWDRSHFGDKWAGDDNMLVVHGHTPVYYFGEDNQKPITYCDGHKINIDCGTVFSKPHTITILDLDTLEEHEIKV